MVFPQRIIIISSMLREFQVCLRVPFWCFLLFLSATSLRKSPKLKGHEIVDKHAFVSKGVFCIPFVSFSFCFLIIYFHVCIPRVRFSSLCIFIIFHFTCFFISGAFIILSFKFHKKLTCVLKVLSIIIYVRIH